MRTFHALTHPVRAVAIVLLTTLTLSSVFTVSATPPQAPAQATYGKWGVGTLTDAELSALIAQMTIAEETGMVHGGTDTTCSTSTIGCVSQAGYLAGVARLGIPPLRLTDGPAGIRLSYQTTAVPASVNLAATFNRDAAYDLGMVMGREGRATNQDVLLAPMTNQVVVPTAGRNFETLGEDPYLAGELVEPQVRGIQSEGLIATIKHYIMNDFENNRTSASVTIDERSLHEMELQAFEKAVKADVGAAMCSYNRINDVYGCSNNETQNVILRGLLGFSGFIMSDWGATHRTSDLINGLDMQMSSGTTAGLGDAPLATAVTSGTAAIAVTNDLPAVPAYSGTEWKTALDAAVFRTLKQMNNAGLLEGTQYGSHYTDGTPYIPERPVLSDLKAADYAIAQQVAEESATLLKNDSSLLPLKSSDFSGNGVLLMGPTSVTPYIGGGGSSNVTPFSEAPSPYEELTAAAGSGANIRYVPGYDLDGQLLPSTAVTAPISSTFSGQNGWLRTQISTTAPASGSAPAACSSDCAAEQLDPTVDYTGTSTLPANTAWRWQSTLTAPSAGSWTLKIFAKNQSSAQLFVDGLTTSVRRINMGAYGVASGGIGSSAVSSWHKLGQTAKSHNPELGQMQQASYSVTFTANETHTLDLRAYANASSAMNVRFMWVPTDWQSQKIAEAVAAAQTANKVLLFAYDEGTEGSDRGTNNQATGLTLPGYQNDLIAAVAAANPNTIVVLNTGDPVLMPWVSSVPAILEMWYPGQMGGAATADVLMGTANPGGKLPVTFPADPTVMPTYSASCDPTAIAGTNDGNCPLYPGVYKPGFVSGNHSYKTVDFETNGIFVGYRWYDKHDETPLFPFGHGLSYTSFSYDNLTTTPTSTGLDVSFDVTNSGSVAGAEIPQVYLGPSGSAPVELAEKSLVGFDRIELAAGETKHVTISVDKRELSFWSVDTHDWELALGARAIMIGASSRDIRLTLANATQPSGTLAASRSADSNGWYNHAVDFSATGTGVAGITVTCGTSSYSGADSAAADVSVTCTDAAGNTRELTTTIKYDSSKPTLAPVVSPNPVALNGAATVSANATDSLSGIAGATCGALDTSSAGTKTVTCTATDNAGNSASATVSYTVSAAQATATPTTGPGTPTATPVTPTATPVTPTTTPTPTSYKVLLPIIAR